MRNKKWFGVITIILAVGMTACGNQGDGAGTTPTQSASGIFKPIEDTTIAIQVSETDRMKGLCEVLKKKAVTEAAKYNAMNRVGTISDETGQQSLFCIDPDTGVVYFVNQNKDCYIYRLKDGEAKLAVALPAKELSIRNGTLYFMIESYDKYELSGINDGDIYAYTPADGSVKAVYAAGALGSRLQQLAVKENGVYFRCTTDGNKMVIDGREVSVLEDKHYYLPFDAKEPVEDKNKTTLPGWGEYYLTTKQTTTGDFETVLQSRSDKASEYINLNIENAAGCSIIGDEIYYIGDRASVCVRNLVTGELKSYDCLEALELAGGNISEERAIESFTMVGDYIWAKAYSVFLLRINPESKEVLCYRLLPGSNEEDTEEKAQKETEGEYTLQKLYTDGEHLYALYAPGLQTKGCLVQIITDQTAGLSKAYKVPLLEVKYITE